MPHRTDGERGGDAARAAAQKIQQRPRGLMGEPHLIHAHGQDENRDHGQEIGRDPHSHRRQQEHLPGVFPRRAPVLEIEIQREQDQIMGSKARMAELPLQQNRGESEKQRRRRGSQPAVQEQGQQHGRRPALQRKTGQRIDPLPLERPRQEGRQQFEQHADPGDRIAECDVDAVLRRVAPGVGVPQGEPPVAVAVGHPSRIALLDVPLVVPKADPVHPGWVQRRHAVHDEKRQDTDQGPEQKDFPDRLPHAFSFTSLYFCSFSMLSTRYFCFLKVSSSSRERYLTTMVSTANSPAKPRVSTNMVVVQPATGLPVKKTISV